MAKAKTYCYNCIYFPLNRHADVSGPHDPLCCSPVVKQMTGAGDYVLGEGQVVLRREPSRECYIRNTNGDCKFYTEVGR